MPRIAYTVREIVEESLGVPKGRPTDTEVKG